MDTSYLRLIRKTYYVQVRVPRKLVSIVGKAHLLRSTGTRNLAEANRVKHGIIADFMAEIEAARINDPNANTPARKAQAEAALLRQQVLSGSIDHDEAIAAFAQSLSIVGDKHNDWRDGGRGGVEVTKSQYDNLITARDALKTLQVSLSEAMAAYLAHNTDLQPSTIHKRTVRIKAFIEWYGDKPVSGVTRQDAGRYITEKLRTSSKALSTQRQEVGDLFSWFRYCVTYALSESSNPWADLSSTIKGGSRGTKAKTAAKLRPWADPELVQLFTQPLKKKMKDDLCIMALLALYTGARQNELAEAELEDVHDDYLDIPESKSEAGIRVIPWHPVIRPLVQHLVDTSSDGYLVSGLRRGGSDDKRNHYFSSRFSYHKVHVRKLPPAINFHSFRKNFSTQLVQHQVPTPEIQQVIGHESQELVHRVYSSGVDVERLLQVVQKVKYSDPVTRAVQDAVRRLT
jgi:integrase